MSEWEIFQDDDHYWAVFHKERLGTMTFVLKRDAERYVELQKTIADQAAEIEEMERVIAYVEQEYAGSYGEWLAALEGDS